MEAFAILAERLTTDHDGVRREIEAKLVAEKGQEWLDAHRQTIDADWEQAMQLLGFGPSASEEEFPPIGR